MQVVRKSAGMEYAHAQFEVTDLKRLECAVDGPNGTKTDGEVAEFEGMASTFGNVDRHDDIIEAGAFQGITERNSRGTLRVKMFVGHDSRLIPGVWTQLTQNNDGLFAKGRLLLGTQLGAETYEQLKSGALDSMSVGFRIPKGGATFDTDDEEFLGTRRIQKAELFEISLVAIPANPQAVINDVKDFDSSISERELESLLKNHLGMSRRDARALVTHGIKGLSMRTDDELGAEVGEGDAASDVQEAEAKARAMVDQSMAVLHAIKVATRDSHQIAKGLRTNEQNG